MPKPIQSIAHEWLTVAQAAEHLMLSTQTILRWIKIGKLRATKIGQSYRISRAAIDEILTGNGGENDQRGTA